ncbi:MAG TPA: hypothetical protein VLH12_07955 [Usitatibacter sp.]|nr:hypothetical protein [Usitatibacter sp.]
MNLFIWMLAGAALGWASFAFLGFSEGRGKMASVVIGGFGGVLGGKMIAPMLTAPAAVAGGFSMSALMTAAVVASLILVVANLINKRWDI